MLVIPIKDGENVDRALKRFKRKFEKTGIVKEIRNRQAFESRSVKERRQKIKAIYRKKIEEQDE